MPSACEQQAMPPIEAAWRERRGAKTRLIGVAVIILGALDNLLTLQADMPSEKYMVVIVLGAVIFAIGEVRSRRDSLREMNHDT